MATGEWLIDWEYAGDEATALIHERIPGSSMLYGIATVESVPCETDEDGDPCLIREGEDSQRLKEVSLIVHAPDMLKAIRAAIAGLEEVTGLNAPYRCGSGADWVEAKDHPTEVVWNKLVVIQDELERAESEACDLEYV